MKRKIGCCLIIIILGLVGAILAPWGGLSSIKDSLFGRSSDMSSLKVYSLGGNMKVFIDGKDRGTVSQEDTYLEVFPITIGDHEVKLVREESGQDFYPEFKREIYFENGFDTVISYEIGPTDDSSSGWLLYAKASDGGDEKAHLHMSSGAEDLTVEIDNTKVKDLPGETYELSLEKQHSVKVSSKGYQTLKFLILPEDEEGRNALKGYDLYLDVNLYKFVVD